MQRRPSCTACPPPAHGDSPLFVHRGMEISALAEELVSMNLRHLIDRCAHILLQQAQLEYQALFRDDSVCSCPEGGGEGGGESSSLGLAGNPSGVESTNVLLS
mmetsp:Transcript_31966/g.92550  ORF Transcript_31966/g.92550 Transcript_31966/m.92550 type:complete len:103 (+) Transcript_31966:744-1052(+)